MTEKREAVNKPDSISKIWVDEASYCEEPWCVIPLDDGEGEIYAKDAKACYGHALPLSEAYRIAACVNFCREFDTEFLEKHTLRYIAEQEATVAMALPLQPGFVGLIACFEKGDEE